MRLRTILILLMLGSPPSLWADLDCGVDERPVVQYITVNDYAGDLFPIPIYNPDTGQEELLATGGQGFVTDIQNTWNVDEAEIGFNNFNIATLTFTESTSDAEFLEDIGNSRYKVQFCLPDSANSTTSHAIYLDGGLVKGIFSGVGLVYNQGNGDEIDLILNRATGTWFKGFNEGKSRSGHELVRNVVEQVFERPERTLSEQVVVTLNESYAQQLDAQQLRANGERVDVEGLTVFVQDILPLICLSPTVSSYKINGEERLGADNCVSLTVEDIGRQTLSVTNGYRQEGSIMDARVGEGQFQAVTMTCDGDEATAHIAYEIEPLNQRTTFLQGNTRLVTTLNNTDFSLPCADTEILIESLGNTNEPRHKWIQIFKVEGNGSGVYDITVKTFVKDDGEVLLATGHPSEEIIKLVWDLNTIDPLIGIREYLCEDNPDPVINTIDEIISNVNLALSAAQKNEFYGEPASGMEKYTNDDDFDDSFCDEDEPDGGFTNLIELTIVVTQVNTGQLALDYVNEWFPRERFYLNNTEARAFFNQYATEIAEIFATYSDIGLDAATLEPLLIDMADGDENNDEFYKLLDPVSWTKSAGIVRLLSHHCAGACGTDFNMGEEGMTQFHELTKSVNRNGEPIEGFMVNHVLNHATQYGGTSTTPDINHDPTWGNQDIN